MQGDFSRVTFDAGKHFSAVLSQQGRVQLDADTNEQAAILLHYLRTVVTDLIGPSGVPIDPDQPFGGGFSIAPVMLDQKGVVDLDISPGRMYVDGILVENESYTTYWQQPDGYLVPDETTDQLPDEGTYLVYLRAFERLVTAAEDASIREVALGDHGPDTCARAKVVWQVATVTDAGDLSFPGEGASLDDWIDWLRGYLLREEYRVPLLSAWATRPDDADTNVCDVDPDSRYRGPENQLYRVEIHHGGSSAEATFKWSRENASVVLPIESIDGPTVTLAALGRDGKLGLEIGDLVEVVDDAYTARIAFETEPDPRPKLYQVKELDTVARLVILSGSPAHECGGVGSDALLHPYLRRWDHDLTDSDDGAIALTEEEDYELEDGVFVRFEARGFPLTDKLTDKKKRGSGGDDAPPTDDDDDGSAADYRRGDYWLIPARVVTGDVEWPKENGEPVSLPPAGVEYHYAPLALVNATSADPVADLRPRFAPLTGTAQLAAGEQAAKPEPDSGSGSGSGSESAAKQAPRPAKKTAARKTTARKSAAPDKD